MSEHTPHQRDSRVALLTGAARGIGLGIAERLVRDGWQVVLADIDGTECEQAAARLGPAARAIKLDVRDEEQVREAIRHTEEWHGGLDALVNNAGISDPHSGPLEELELADWQRWLDTNLTGAFLLGKHALPLLRRRRGAIVNISSTRAAVGARHRGLRRQQGRAGRLHPCPGHQRRPGGPRQRHPPRLDRHPPPRPATGRAAIRAGPRPAPSRPRRPAGRHRRPDHLPARTRRRLRHRPDLDRRRRHDPPHDLHRLTVIE